MLLRDKKHIEQIQLIYFVILLVLFCVFVLALPRISIPLFLAYVQSLALTPVLNFMISMGIKKTQGIIIIFVILTTIIGIPLFNAIPVAIEESKNIQTWAPKIETYVKSQYKIAQSYIRQKTGYFISDAYINEGIDLSKSWGDRFVVKVPNYLATLFEWIFLIPFFTFFILRDSEVFKNKFLAFTPNSIFERFYFVTHVFNHQLGNYFFAKFIEALIVGLIIGIGLFILDFKLAILFGFVAGITNIIPYVGPLLGALPAIVLAMTEYGINSSEFGAVAALYIIANVIDVAFVFPFLVSKIVNLHPMLVAISVIVGSHYMGVTGMIISIPVVAALKLIVTEVSNELYPNRYRN